MASLLIPLQFQTRPAPQRRLKGASTMFALFCLVSGALIALRLVEG